MSHVRLSSVLMCVAMGSACLMCAPMTANANEIVAGDDYFASIGAFTLEIFEPFFPGGFIEVILLNSEGTLAMVHRDMQVGDNPGTIDTEIVSLDLFGVSANVGPVHLRVGDRVDSHSGHPVGPGPEPFAPVQFSPTLGQIQNVQTAGGSDQPSAFISGDSFFDVFFEIDAGGMTFYNRDPFILEAEIFSLPPLGTSYYPWEDVDLFLMYSGMPDPGDPLVGRISSASSHHTPVPDPASTVLLLLMGLTGSPSLPIG